MASMRRPRPLHDVRNRAMAATFSQGRGRSEIAVCFSGWLNVSIPASGSLARRNLVDVLHADVFVAATFHVNSECASCLMERLRGLQPLKRFRIDPMLQLHQLEAMAHQAPRFHNVEKAFNYEESVDGLNSFAPVLGNKRVSILREYHDYSRVLNLVEEEERAAGVNYSRIIFSRLEKAWLVPHPPLFLLDPRLVWIGVYDALAVNDRHAVMPRHFADVYFRRFELLMSDTLLEVLPLESLTHDGPVRGRDPNLPFHRHPFARHEPLPTDSPSTHNSYGSHQRQETILENLLIAHSMPVGFFPSTWYIACCSSNGHNQCWADHNCPSERLPTTRCVRPRELVYTNESWPTRPWAMSWIANDRRDCATHATGKYAFEVEMAVLHSSLSRCAAAQWRVQSFPLALPAKARRLKTPADWVRRSHRFNWSLQQAAVYLDIPVRQGTRSATIASVANSPLVTLMHPHSRWRPACKPLCVRPCIGLPGDDLWFECGSCRQHWACNPSAAGFRTRTQMVSTAFHLRSTNLLACPLQASALSQQLTTLLRRSQQNWTVGTCGVTREGVSDCDKAESGSMRLPRGVTWPVAAELCLEWCLKCPRCNFVSLSLEWRDCSWFHDCDSPRDEPQGFRSLRLLQ